MSKLIGCESFSAPPSETAGIAEAIGVEAVDFEEDSTGILYHLEYMRFSYYSFVRGEYLTVELY